MSKKAPLERISSRAGGLYTRPFSAAVPAAAFAAIVSMVSPWSISIPPAHLAQTFGYQTPACWLVAAALLAASILELRLAVVAVAVASGTVVAWLAWAMLVVTTPRFASLPFPFVGTDVIGGGWYAAAVGLLVVAGFAVSGLARRSEPGRMELAALTVLPGYGLMRLGEWARGLIFTVLFSSAFYLASTDSPDPALFADYGQSNNVPPPIPRWPEWVLLAISTAIWLAGVGLTLRRAGRRGWTEAG